MIYGVVPVISPETIKAHHLTGSDIAVWYATCSFAQWERVDGKPVRSKPGSCFPTRQAIAERAGVTDRQVKLSLSRLETLGLIERKARIGDNGERRSNEYILKAVL